MPPRGEAEISFDDAGDPSQGYPPAGFVLSINLKSLSGDAGAAEAFLASPGGQKPVQSNKGVDRLMAGQMAQALQMAGVGNAAVAQPQMTMMPAVAGGNPSAPFSHDIA